MKIVKVESFQTWLAYNAVKILCGSHHITNQELDDAVLLYKASLDEDFVILQPFYDGTITRSGTPVI